MPIKAFFLIIFINTLIISPFETTLAHRPLDTSGSATREDPIIISDHQVSWVAYNYLPPNGVHYYRFVASQDDTIYASLLIPYLNELKDFNPVIALIIPQPGEEKPVNYNQLVIKEGESVIVKRFKDEERKIFTEPFTQTVYWEKQKLEIKAPATGVYYLTIFTEDNKNGKYVLSIGKREEWGLKDLVKIPLIWWNVRMFVEKRISTYIISITLLTLFFYAISIIGKKFFK